MSEQEPNVNDSTNDNDLDPTNGNKPNGDSPNGNEAASSDSASGDACEPTVEIPGHEQELTKMRAERDQLDQKLQRAIADTQNIRRRQRQEMDDGRRRVLEGLTQELLPVLDSFGLALKAYDGDGEAAEGSGESQPSADKSGDTAALVEGVRMVKTLLSGALERHGLQEIPAIGQAFDPARHEALGVEPNGEVPENQVVRVVQTGYVLGEHVVRHSKVIVSGPQQ